MMDLAVQCRSPMGEYLIELDKLEGDPDTLFRRELRNRLQSASSTWASTYRDINSDLSVHPMYQQNHYICELHRIATTRLRLSSHRLRIETGWWSRIPREERMCSCGENVQTESHVLFQCPQTAVLRLEHINLNFDSLTSYMSNQDLAGMCFYAHKVLSTVA